MAVNRDKVIASAEKLVAKGKIEPAIKEYERLLADFPNDVNTLNRIGDLWVRINRSDEAVVVFTKIADHYSKDGFFLKAIAIYKKINKLDPSKLDIYAKLADLYAKQGLAMEAKSQYQILADYHLKHGDPNSALATYRKIAELDPNSINVHVKLADLYSQNNRTAEALKEYDRVGKMLLKRGMLDEAVAVFKKALKIDASNVELAESLVNTLIESKDYDNSIQILEQSLEANRANPRLIALLGRTHLARGEAGLARKVLEEGLAANPMEGSIREMLAELYIRQREPDRALDLLGPMAENAAARSDRSAVEMLQRILRTEPSHVGTLQKLVAVYTRLREETNILSALNSLAEAHIARREHEAAAGVLRDLLSREPENSQHREKLAFVQQLMGGAPAAPQARPAAPEPPPKVTPPPAAPLPPPAPEISFDLGSTSQGFEADFGTTDLSGSDMELSFDLDAAVEIGVDVPVSAEPPQAAVEEDVDFITEHLTEAEVFAKYGLSEKAIEHLRAVLDRYPEHTTALEKILAVYMEEADRSAAQQTAAKLIGIFEQRGEQQEAARIQNLVLARGYAPTSAPAPVTPPLDFAIEPELDDATLLPAELAPDENLSFDIEATADTEIEFEIEEPSFSGAATISDAPEPLPEETMVPEEPFFGVEAAREEPSFDFTASASDFGLAGPAIEEPLPTFDETPEPEQQPEVTFEATEDEAPAFTGFDDDSFETEVAEAPAADTFGAQFEPELEEPSFESTAGTGFGLDESVLADFAPATPAEELPFEGGFDTTAGPEADFDFGSASAAEESEATEVYESGAVAPISLDDELEVEAPPAADELPLEAVGEIDFYLEQDFLDQARAKLISLEERFPGHPELASRRRRIDELTRAASAPAASIFSAADIENELALAMPDDEEEPAAAPAGSGEQFLVQPVDEANLFADEDDFFDLAAELEEELEEDTEEIVSLSEEEQTLEQIFKEFKKGVEQQLDSEDYDTHYNLGIAYKEMGLIDEAIGEFQLASKDPKRTIECCSMLGLCFLEKGMPQLAIKWYRKGLESPEITEEEHLGLLYDLGTTYLEIGDTENAHKAFLEVYGMNTNYRDIVERMKQLENVGN